MNETVVLETCNQTVVLDKPQTNAIMDATVVIDKGIYNVLINFSY